MTTFALVESHEPPRKPSRDRRSPAQAPGGVDPRRVRRDVLRGDLNASDPISRQELATSVDRLVRAAELLAATRSQSLGRRLRGEATENAEAATRAAYVDLLLVVEDVAHARQELTRYPMPTPEPPALQEDPVSTTTPEAPETDDVLATRIVLAIAEAAAEYGVELPDPDRADLAPVGTVDPGPLDGHAPHGWVVYALAPVGGGKQTLGLAAVAQTPHAARLAVAYLRGRGWQAHTRPHNPTPDTDDEDANA